MKLMTVLLILSVSCFTSCNNEPPNPACQKFHQGEFKYVDQLFGDYLVTRTTDKQVEYNAKSNLKVEFGIKWKNDCTYEVRFNKILSNPGNLSLPPDLGDMVKTCKITEINEGNYTEEATSNLNKSTNKTVYEKLK